MSRGRHETLRRILLVRERIEGLRYPVSLHELAREFDVSSRTMRRDLQLLEEVGCHVPMWRYLRKAA